MIRKIVLLQPINKEIQLDPTPLLSRNFFWWRYATLIFLNDSLKLFRHLGDDDLIALSLCAIKGGLLDIGNSGAKHTSGDTSYADIDVSKLSVIALKEYAGITGIPNETARRKVLSDLPQVPIKGIGSASMRLERFPAEVDYLERFAFALARAILDCLDIPASNVRAECDFVGRALLVERFIELLLSQIRVRRVQTREIPGVSVQCAISLGVAQQVFNLSVRRGQPRAIDLPQYLRAFVEVSELNRPVYLSLLEDCTGLDRAQVFATCKRLRDAGVLRKVERDRIFRASPAGLSSAELKQQVLPEDVWRSTINFVNIAGRVLVSVG